MTSSKFKLKQTTVGVYQIRNLINSKVYIGSAVNLNHRFRTHKSKLNTNKHPSKHLQASWNKYGDKSFVFEILEYCEKEQLLIIEQFYLDKKNLNELYNKRKIAKSNQGWVGWKQDKDWIEKRASKLRGRKITDIEILKNISEGQKGKSLSIEHKNNVSKSLKGHFVSLETRNKIGKAHSKPEKWPHGYKCNCRECLDRKNEIKSQNRIKISSRYSHLNKMVLIQW